MQANEQTKEKMAQYSMQQFHSHSTHHAVVVASAVVVAAMVGVKSKSNVFQGKLLRKFTKHYGATNGRTNGPIDGQTSGPTDRWMDQQGD